jgi:hypothetical protein
VVNSDKGKTGIQGTLLMLDDTTPHVAVVVQAIRDGNVMATALSDEQGRYQLIDLEPGQYHLRCYVLNGYVYYSEGGNTVADESSAVSLQTRPGVTHDNINLRFAPFKKGTWRTYTYLDGLASNTIHTLYYGADGVMWFATAGGGVSRYDGKEFVNLTTKDGLLHNHVSAIHRDPDGVMWFSTGHLTEGGGGISRYDGKEFVNFTTKDGLLRANGFPIHRDTDGVMWFGTSGGVSRYDGKQLEML